jgi:hypothetical protein
MLDLVLTDMPSAFATVGPKIRDHNFVLVDLGQKMPEVTNVERSVWDYAKADWDRLRDSLEEVDWDFVRTEDVHEGTRKLTETISLTVFHT